MDHLKEVVRKLKSQSDLDYKALFNADKTTIKISLISHGLPIDDEIPYSFEGFKSLISNSQLWSDIVNRFENEVCDRSYKLIRIQLAMILKANKLYQEKFSIKFPKPNLSRPCDDFALERQCVQLFITRFAFNCLAVRELMNEGLEKFEAFELSIGILLRACLLDVKLIACWNHKPEFLNFMVSESFLPNNLPKHIDQNALQGFRRLHDFYNPNKIKFTSDDTKKMLANLAPQLKKDFEELYLFYSKYDHFSFIPILSRHSVRQQLMRTLRSVDLIRQFMFMVISRNSNLPKQEFSEILGMNEELNEQTGHYKLLSVSSKDLLSGEFPVFN
ncbi:hypothetical protein [Dyadobacter crusticola]|uniref:hypothetical protein n=1 Tax=Dyadobacter crusticola TaxID=292407 RepID=UPI0004E1320B|nr:hypothetical protein [Dyadobacter crusticola]